MSEDTTKAQVTDEEHSTTATHAARIIGVPLALLLGVLVPLSVHAGVFGSLSGLFSNKEAHEVAAAPVVALSNPDNYYIKATTNPSPTGATGGGDIIVREGFIVSGGVVGDEDEESRTSNGEISVYVVREGDSLSQIAEMYDVTTNTILWANDIQSATDIHPGDTLVILPIVGIRHVVKDGDTISTIAKKYGGDLDEILSYNQLASADELSIGDTLVIPGGELHSAPPKRTVAKSSGPVRVVGGGSTNAALSHPLPGAIRTQGIHGYNGVDLAAPAGTPIRAAAAGEIIISKVGSWNGGYGNYVVVRHANGMQTLYAHNSSNAVVVGEYVAVGQTIGYVGSTGRSTGDHLHFEVRGGSNPF